MNIPRCSDRKYRQHPGAQERTRQYNMQLKRIATNSCVDIVDAYALFAELGEAATGSDGIHPTVQCSRQLAERIVEMLARLRDEFGGATEERDGRNHCYGCIGG